MPGAETDSSVLSDRLDEAKKALSAAILGDPSNRAEAKSWVISTLANLQQVPAATRLSCFSPVGSSSYHSRPYARSRSRSRDRDRPGSRHSNEGSYQRRESSSRQMSSPTVYNHSSSRDHEASRGSYQAQQQLTSPLQYCKPATLQLLQLLTDAQPPAVSQLLSQDSNFLSGYLTSTPATISSWFGHFSLSGIQHFKYGARALANYALTHRSDVWEYLVWRGKHDQAPVAVAAKPHYFAELDVPKTLRNLAKYYPEFWCSDELLRSCEGGEWLKLNPDMVAQELYRLLHHPSPRHQQLLQLITSYIQSADWAVLCNRLLLLLEEQQLLDFVRLLAQQQQQQQHQLKRQQRKGQLPTSLQQWVDKQTAYNRQKSAARQASSGPTAAAAAAASQLPCVAEMHLLVLAAAEEGCGLDDVLLVNALTCHKTQLLTLLRRDEDAACHLLKLAAAAQELFSTQQRQQQQQQGRAGEGEAPRAAGVVPGRVLELLKDSATAKSRVAASKQLMLLPLVGWLLRLHLLLACAAGQVQWQQALQQLGCTCQPAENDAEQLRQHQVKDEQAGHQQVASEEQQQHLRQQSARQHDEGETHQAAGDGEQQQQQGQGVEAEEVDKQQQQQLQDPGPVPLRRGQPGVKLAVKKHKVRLKHSNRARHKGSKPTLGKRKCRHNRGSSSGESGSSSSSSTDSGDEANRQHAARKHRKHRTGKHKAKHKKRRQAANSSSSSDWEEGSEIDYDAGGELLDPADFQQQQQPLAAPSALLDASATAGGSSRRLVPAAGDLSAEQQQQLSRVLDALDSLSGAKMMSPAGVVVRLPVQQCAAAATGSGAAGQPVSLWVSGAVVELADAVAWYCICRWLCAQQP